MLRRSPAAAAAASIISGHATDRRRLSRGRAAQAAAGKILQVAPRPRPDSSRKRERREGREWKRMAPEREKRGGPWKQCSIMAPPLSLPSLPLAPLLANARIKCLDPSAKKTEREREAEEESRSPLPVLPAAMVRSGMPECTKTNENAAVKRTAKGQGDRHRVVWGESHERLTSARPNGDNENVLKSNYAANGKNKTKWRARAAAKLSHFGGEGIGSRRRALQTSFPSGHLI